MKTIKYIIGSLLIAMAIAGCAGSSGSSNFDQIDKATNTGVYEMGESSSM